jgi:hypothetical protein
MRGEKKEEKEGKNGKWKEEKGCTWDTHVQFYFFKHLGDKASPIANKSPTLGMG